MRNICVKRAVYILVALILFVFMLSINNQLIRASTLMDSLLDFFEIATVKWTESRMLLSIEADLNFERQQLVSDNLSEIITILSLPQINLLSVFTEIGESRERLELDIDDLILKLPIRYGIIDSVILESIEDQLAITKLILREYRRELDQGYAYLVQAQVILILLLVVFIVIAVMDRSQQRLYVYHQKRVQGEITRVQEHERHKIALDLHDVIAQELSWLRLNLNSTDTLSDQRLVLDNLLVRVRDMSQGLRWPDFSVEPFDASLRDLIDLIERRSNVLVGYVPGLIQPKLQPEVYGHLYRIVQECLNNASHHAGTCRCCLEIQEEANTVFLDYRDDGAGFDMKGLEQTSRIGLKGIQYRVLLLNGKLTIDSKIGKGTSIAVRIPLGSGN